jgi:hypothetical protein
MCRKPSVLRLKTSLQASCTSPGFNEARIPVLDRTGQGLQNFPRAFYVKWEIFLFNRGHDVSGDRGERQGRLAAEFSHLSDVEVLLVPEMIRA